MAALTDNIEIQEKAGVWVSKPVVASDIIYRGAMTMDDADGYLQPCAALAGAKFAGIAIEKVDNSSGSSGDKECKVVQEGVFLLNGSGFAQSDVNSVVYASDDQTVTTTSAANLPVVGHIVAYQSATQVWVKLAADGVGTLLGT